MDNLNWEGEMILSKVVLRKARIEDCDDIYRWRNDEDTRQQSFISNEVPYERHCSWFKEALKDPLKVLYIGIDGSNEKYGIVRFDIRNDSVAEININLAPEKRGRGIGATLIRRSSEEFLSLKGMKLVLARTKEENIASIKAFLKAGYFEIFRYIDVEKGRVVVLGLVRGVNN